MILSGIFFVLLLAADYSLLSKKDISFTLPVSGFTLVFLSYIPLLNQIKVTGHFASARHAVRPPNAQIPGIRNS